MMSSILNSAKTQLLLAIITQQASAGINLDANFLATGTVSEMTCRLHLPGSR
jgi:hypothetical protein